MSKIIHTDISKWKNLQKRRSEQALSYSVECQLSVEWMMELENDSLATLITISGKNHQWRLNLRDKYLMRNRLFILFYFHVPTNYLLIIVGTIITWQWRNLAETTEWSNLRPQVMGQTEAMHLLICSVEETVSCGPDKNV